MYTKLRLLALAAALALPAGIASAASPAGYFTSPDAPLVPPTAYDTGSGATTLPRQATSGYFATPDWPLVPPATPLGNGSDTLAKQRASGYFAEAGAPLYPPTSTVR